MRAKKQLVSRVVMYFLYYNLLFLLVEKKKDFYFAYAIISLEILCAVVNHQQQKRKKKESTTAAAKHKIRNCISCSMWACAFSLLVWNFFHNFIFLSQFNPNELEIWLKMCTHNHIHGTYLTQRSKSVAFFQWICCNMKWKKNQTKLFEIHTEIGNVSQFEHTHI